MLGGRPGDQPPRRLRPQPPATALVPEEVAALRQELADLRKSVAVTRNAQSAPGDSAAVAHVERRLARLEATRPAPGRPATANPDAADPDDESLVESSASVDGPTVMADGTPRFAELRAADRSVQVRQIAGGSLVVANNDPKLTGQLMVVKARTAEGDEQDVLVTVPPPV